METELLEMLQVHGNAMEPGTWVLAKYEDTEERVVYMCACGKVNAIDKSRLDESGQVVDAEGNPETVACENKFCGHTHELRFLEGTLEAMDAHRAAKLLREAAEHALAAGVTSDELGRAEVRRAEAAAEEALS